jgi:hypothetical protein
MAMLCNRVDRCQLTFDLRAPPSGTTIQHSTEADFD